MHVEISNMNRLNLYKKKNISSRMLNKRKFQLIGFIGIMLIIGLFLYGAVFISNSNENSLIESKSYQNYNRNKKEMVKKSENKNFGLKSSDDTDVKAFEIFESESQNSSESVATFQNELKVKSKTNVDSPQKGQSDQNSFREEEKLLDIMQDLSATTNTNDIEAEGTDQPLSIEKEENENVEVDQSNDLNYNYDYNYNFIEDASGSTVNQAEMDTNDESAQKLNEPNPDSEYNNYDFSDDLAAKTWW